MTFARFVRNAPLLLASLLLAAVLGLAWHSWQEPGSERDNGPLSLRADDGSVPEAGPPSGVSFNGRELPRSVLTILERGHGVSCARGQFWYDRESGLYGALGHAAYGWMRAGLELPPLERAASRGASGVLLNGRELPVEEWGALSRVAGRAVRAGPYRLDAGGVLTSLSGPSQRIDLVRQGPVAGASRGDDPHHWSLRFCSGARSARLSLPGVGPAAAGF